MSKLEEKKLSDNQPAADKVQAQKTKERPKKTTRPKTKKSIRFFTRVFNRIQQIKHKKRIMVAFVVIVVIVTIIYLACNVSWACVSWSIRSNFREAKTYPFTSIFDNKVGNLSQKQLNSKLLEINKSFYKRQITFRNNKDTWSYSMEQLGAEFDIDKTQQKAWDLNKLGLVGKLKLFHAKQNVIRPIISVSTEKCNKTLSMIPITEQPATDAIVYYDNGLKIRESKQGLRYNSAATCAKLADNLADNKTIIDLSIDKIQPKISEQDIKSVWTKVLNKVNAPIDIQAGGYKTTLNTQQLVDLLQISKTGNKIELSWSSTKIDVLIDGIAQKVDTNADDPSGLGSCQYVINAGGDWLDKDTSKEILIDSNEEIRSFTLPIAHHEPQIGTRSPVGQGSNGTVYLTFDDGLTYADQIMNYASCYGVKVTFFELGSMVWTDATAIKRAISEGHSVQAHGFEHAATNYGTGHDYTWQYNDIASSISSITSVSGVRPTYFRPPGGNKTAATYDAASANGVSLILWNVSSADTVAEFGPQAICSNVVNGAFSGASILMHSTKQKTANAVPCIIEGLAARGFDMQALR